MKIIQPFQHEGVRALRLGYSPLRWIQPLSVCLYEVDGLLVDTGQRTMQREVGEWVNRDTIQQIFLTHYHEDHSGNARFFCATARGYLCTLARTPRSGWRIRSLFSLRTILVRKNTGLSRCAARLPTNCHGTAHVRGHSHARPL